MTFVVRTHNLTKNIGGKELVSNLNLHVKKGEIYGFLGPNGAGKTTTMRMLLNLWKPTQGEVELFGQVMNEASYEIFRRMAGIIEFPVFYEKLNGRENLELHCEYMGYYSPDAIVNALGLLGLESAARKPVREYSLGMKQRLGLARAILTKPELLILDEPANGLDPAGMKQVRDLLKMLSTEYGMTIMISSHILAEVEPIADTIGFIRDGKLLQEKSMEEIKRDTLGYIEVHSPELKKAAYFLTEKLHTDRFKVIDKRRIFVYEKRISVPELSRMFAEGGIPVEFIGQKTESLEDYFLKMTDDTGKYAALETGGF